MDVFHARRPNDPAANIRARWGLRPVVNCSGNNTALGASSVLPGVIDACNEIMAEFVDIVELHRKASQTIARVFDTEAGTVTASLASAWRCPSRAASQGQTWAALSASRILKAGATR